MQALYEHEDLGQAPGKIRTAAEENVDVAACGGVTSGSGLNLRLD
jgi:hypothetical protein